MGKYIIVVAIVILTAIIAGIFPYTQNNNVNEQSLVAVLDTFYSADIDSNKVAICYLGDSAFFMRTLNHVVLLDPGDKIKEKDIHAVKNLDILLISQKDDAHYESETTMNIYKKTNSTIITNREVCNELREYVPSYRLRELQPSQRSTFSGVAVTALSSNDDSYGPLSFIASMDGIEIFCGSGLDHTNFVLDLPYYSNTADIAVVPTEGASTGTASQRVLDIVRTLRPRIVVTMHGSLDEQSALKNLLNKEFPNVEVLLPEKLWLYELVV